MKTFFRTLFLFFTLCGALSAQVYNQFECGGDINGAGCTWNNQVITNGAVTLAKQANLAADSFQGNATNAAATPQAFNPLAAANLMSAVVSVVAYDSQVTAVPSGLPQTIDGVSISAGQAVFIQGNTAQSFSGIYIAQTSGTWTRAINFPAGYVITQNCVLTIFVQKGTLYGGSSVAVNTTSAITIGTSNITSAQISYHSATDSIPGLVTTTDTAGSATAVILNGASPNAQYDCASFVNDNNAALQGDIGDNGNIQFNNTAHGHQGGCTVTDSFGHIYHDGSGTAPVVTGTGCSLTAGGTDESGSIVATGVDTCTVTFGQVFAIAPNCSVTGVGVTNTVLPWLSALPTTSAFISKTTAAGTYTYLCSMP
jgi:hypothetical protein